ncbi:type II toxin-antitoxin system YoeB family toxin [Breznakiellaceae bacterium SP9]
MNTKFCEDNRQQYTEWALSDRKVFTKLNKLITEIERTPYTGTGHPEPPDPVRITHTIRTGLRTR